MQGGKKDKILFDGKDQEDYDLSQTLHQALSLNSVDPITKGDEDSRFIHIGLLHEHQDEDKVTVKTSCTCHSIRENGMILKLN